MKLGNVLSQQGHSRPSPTRIVKIKVLGFNERQEMSVGETQAELAFVNESSRLDAMREADELASKGSLSTSVHDDEFMYRMLHRALRDSSDVRQPFADSADEIKRALVLPEAVRVWREYKQFEEEEFPEWVDAETFEKLVEEAKKKPLSDLLSSFGSAVVRRSMSGLVSRLTK